MPLLQISQQPGGAPHRYRISVSAGNIPDRAALSFDIDIAFELKPEDGERIRWYLEDYLQFDEEPAPQIAKTIEAFMAECGDELFRSIFEGSADAIRLWSSLEPHLSTTRIEINTGVAEATAIPWELIRNPHSRTSLALSASSFVRSQRAGQTTLRAAAETEKVRILLVICRPQGGKDVPFRSVAGRLVTRLGEAARGAFDLHVLRPPTYEQLAKTLGLARENGVPFHVVHFDGHGVYADAKRLAEHAPVLSNLALKGEPGGSHGFLAFEDPAHKTNTEFVDGFRLGALLRDSAVPFLVLNACQSAFVEAPPQPATENSTETRQEVEAYGSLAQAVMEAGATGVVAMRYSVYVVTAAQFVAELYGALSRGRQLGEAVSWARKNLHQQPDRQIAYDVRPLQDWSVPVVWERQPLRLWPEKSGAPPIKISLDEDSGATPGELDRALPARPDVGFFGRDETLYALDRAFDTQRIVLLHAYAGSGKTSTAAEFARWYVATGGVQGPVLFTSFERYLPLARVLDKIGEVFGAVLEAAGIAWDTIIDPVKRRAIALQVLRQVPVLWIWDNVEPITGFPAGTASDWSADEQRELRDFLSDARDAKSKFLLTSRRDETAWLGHLALRVVVPDMPMQERLQLAGAIVAQRGRRLAELPDLTALLWFTQGNPLTILVTIGAALRAGIDSKSRLDAFMAVLRKGEVDFQDEATEGRSTSLGASLSYGFGTLFDDEQRRILALLHLFQGIVDVDALRAMGNPEAEWCLAAVRGLTRERGIALLDRAAEIGLLTPHGSGYYGIHPALPWYFRALFERNFAETSGDAGRALRAFVEAVGQLGDFYHNAYYGGRREALGAIVAEEDNLLAAWRLARAGRRWGRVISTMQGLRTLYESTGRHAAWRRMVQEVVPDFVDPASDGPLPGREDTWSLVTAYRVRLAHQDRHWAEAERLQHLCVAWDRTAAGSALAIAPQQRDAVQIHHIRMFAVSLHELGQTQREQGSPTCVESYREARDLAAAIGDTAAQAVCTFNLGHAYKDIAALQNLDEAERWYRESLDLRPTTDPLGRGRCLGQLGLVAYERFKEARKANSPAEQIISRLTEAAQLYEQTLGMMPASAVSERGITHNQLGNIYDDGGDTDRALHHYRLAIRFADEAGDTYGAGRRRRNVALTLVGAERLPDARAYAEAALVNFQSFGDRAAREIQQAEQLIAQINLAMANPGKGE